MRQLYYTYRTLLNRRGLNLAKIISFSQHDASFAHRTVHLFNGSIVASVTA